MSPHRAAGYAAVAFTAISGAGSLALFVYFLGAGPPFSIHLGMRPPAALAWDAFLCGVFFAQHSGMVRRPFRRWLGRFLPVHYHAALYTVATAAALVLLVILWQPSGVVLLVLEDGARWIARGMLLVALAGFLWGAASLRHFDLFGTGAILEHLHGREPAAGPLTVRGPYRWVRHPFYASAILALWAGPVLSLDGLLLNVLFTGWIVLGAVLEERDLLAQFGDAYRAYRREVPMLVPWRRPAR